MSVVDSPAISVAPPSAATSRMRREFGSRRGWALHGFWSAALRLGVLRSCLRVDWARVQRLVFVCRGNICRSPYAARRARQSGMRAYSCGLDVASHAAVPSPAEKIARRRGLDLSKHCPRTLGQMRAEPGDLFIPVEPGQLRPVRAHARSAGAQVTLLGLWSTPRRIHLTDPYGLDEEYFNRCFMLIDSAVACMSAKLSEAQRGNCR